jgi:hypothetical protein
MKQATIGQSGEEYIEAQKVVFDYIKHLTTLNTGSIILLTILLEKFFKTPAWGFMVSVIFGGFVLSIIALTLTAFGIIRSIRTPMKITTGLVTFTSWTFIPVIVFFLIAIVSLAIFSIKNWG